MTMKYFVQCYTTTKYLLSIASKEWFPDSTKVLQYRIILQSKVRKLFTNISHEEIKNVFNQQLGENTTDEDIYEKGWFWFWPKKFFLPLANSFITLTDFEIRYDKSLGSSRYFLKNYINQHWRKRGTQEVQGKAWTLPDT